MKSMISLLPPLYPWRTRRRQCGVEVTYTHMEFEDCSVGVEQLYHNHTLVNLNPPPTRALMHVLMSALVSTRALMHVLMSALVSTRLITNNINTMKFAQFIYEEMPVG